MYKARLIFKKTGRARYISHLDLMKTLQRALRRADIAVRYSEGFNPHIVMSILLPLSTGHESLCELCDVELLYDAPPDGIVPRINEKLIEGIEVLKITEPQKHPSDIAYCRYNITYPVVLSGEAEGYLKSGVSLEKRSKRASREVPLSDYVKSAEFKTEGQNTLCDCVLKAGDDPLNPEYITLALKNGGFLDENCAPLYQRIEIFDKNLENFA